MLHRSLASVTGASFSLSSLIGAVGLLGLALLGAPKPVRAQAGSGDMMTQIVSSLELRDDSVLVHRYIQPLKRASNNPNVDAESLAVAKYVNGLPQSVLRAAEKSRENIERNCRRHMKSQIDFSRIETVSLDEICGPRNMEGAITPQEFTLILGFYVGTGIVARKAIERKMDQSDLPFSMEEALRDPTVPPYDTSLVTVYEDTSSIGCTYEAVGPVRLPEAKASWSTETKIRHARGKAGMAGANALLKNNPMATGGQQVPDDAPELAKQMAKKVNQFSDELMEGFFAVRTVHPCE
jgi:hypothetical protein